MKQRESQLQKQRVGKLGENLAVIFLRSLHYKILETNFKARYGEIDVIAEEKDTLVFVEVKTRKGFSYGYPEEAITSRKLKEVLLTAEYYILTHPKSLPLQRIDAIAIALDDADEVLYLKHIKNISQ